MVQAPRRTQAHMTDSKACLLVAQLFSENWVLRDLTERDYGIDRIAERFHDECGTSEMLILQIKGTKSNIDKNNPRFSLETKTLIYAEMFSVPFLLVYCSVNEPSQCYYLWLQEYIRVRLNYENPKWRTQGTNTVYFPNENLLGTPRAENNLTYIAKFPKYQQSWVSYYLSLNDLCYDMPCVLEDVDLWAKEDIDALVEPAIKKLETGKTKFGNIPNRFIPDNYDTTIELGRTILSKPNSDGEQLFMFICNCQRIQRSVEMILSFIHI